MDSKQAEAVDRLLEDERYDKLFEAYYHDCSIDYQEFIELKKPIYKEYGLIPNIFTADERLARLEAHYAEGHYDDSLKTYMLFRKRILKDKEAGF